MTTPPGASRPGVGSGLILASGSPRRRAFFERLGLPFEVHVADVDERARPDERPVDLVARLSCAKAGAVAARYPEATVIGADTIVVLEGEILGKPEDPAAAAAMLRRLRDRPHRVYSSVCVVPPGAGPARAVPALGATDPRVTVVESTVWMRAYTDDEIAAYVASGLPLDKAGAYGIQDARFHPVARLRGCYASVMGLPLCHAVELLNAVRGHNRPAGAVPALCSEVTGVPCCGGDTAEWVWEG